ncbi:methyltransferase-like protein 22 isoform X2 [Xenopus laevis]|uniref:Methyltransferase-like protein 22 isoform X2 n=1 Tax=Xenopus laevis TaxID=8355 RepID=A0A8J1LT31_XENLA|nr:methyltransferase-like protein 22 isoform X2 [Xenopus laevis]
MEEITFTSDTILSEVHLHKRHKRHFMVRLNAVGQPVFQSVFKILSHNNTQETVRKASSFNDKKTEDTEKDYSSCSPEGIQQNDSENIGNLVDEDGDLEVTRRPQSFSERREQNSARNIVCPTIITIGNEEDYTCEENIDSSHNIVKIEHTMATPLEDVGKQIWRGAFLLADYILWQPDLFRDCTVLELGAGTGFTSIIMAMIAKTVYCTDVGEDLLEMCKRNVSLNKCLTEPAGGKVTVKQLDWLKEEFSEDSESPYSWTEEDIADLYDHTTVIIAADGAVENYCSVTYLTGKKVKDDQPSINSE